MRSEEEAYWKAAPDYVRRAFKGSARARYDPEVQKWMAQRAHELAKLPHASSRNHERRGWKDESIKLFYWRFAEANPDKVGFINNDCALRYALLLRGWLNARAGFIEGCMRKAGVLGVSSNAASRANVERVIYEVMGRKSTQRPHDLWANSEEVRQQLDIDFEAVLAVAVKSQGEEWTKKYRVSLQQEFRKQRYELISKTAKTKWKKEATNPSRDLTDSDKPAFVHATVPVLCDIVDWLSEKAGCPVFLAVGGQSIANPGLIEVYT